MQIFKNRMLALFCVSLASVSASVLAWKTESKLLLLLVVVVGYVFSFALSRKLKKHRKKGLYAGAFLLGAMIAVSVSLLFFDCYVARCQKNAYEGAVIKGTVVERIASHADYTCFGIAIEEIDGKKSREQVILECDFPSTLQMGDCIEAKVMQRVFVSDGGYDEESFYLSEGYTRIYTCNDASDYLILKEDDRLLRTKLSEWNTKLSLRLYHAIGGEEGGLAVAFLLGNRSLLSPSAKLDFQRAGVGHLLALSGMHVSILIGFLELILRRLRIAKMIRALFIPIALLGYLMLTGFSPSTVRAVFMVWVLYIGFLLCAQYDSFTALTLVLAILLTVTPYAVLDLSLWMSFVAAASIITFYPAVKLLCNRISGAGKNRTRLRRSLAVLCRAILVSVIANVGLLPLVGFRLGEWSVASVPITLLLSVPLSALLILSLILLLFDGCFFLATVCRFLSKIMLLTSETISDRHGLVFSFASDLERYLLICLALLLVLLAVVRLRRKLMLVSALVAACLLLIVSHQLTARQPLVYLSSSEQTGNFFILSEGGEMIVVVDGDSEWNDTASLAVIADSMRCDEIGDLVITHYDDRYASLISSLSERTKIRRLRLPMPQNLKERAIASRLEEEGALYGIVTCYDTDNLCLSHATDPYTWKDDPPVNWVTVE